jgi:hypothetical protein
VPQKIFLILSLSKDALRICSGIAWSLASARVSGKRFTTEARRTWRIGVLAREARSSSLLRDLRVSVVNLF